ncbi:H/ACA ribonucleoprotein complex subunit 1, putative [Plasmodium malariae]|uniref:H/ACA ribonucleoprotein complex subunit n=1 Tax=Plasmodium malariae TaxID=5858 RepID=A0A1C3L248_PLAMA|nr:H/ACA ribonucleoprotein complex subunit 1, putative [Plasmodium malariae]
MTFFKKNRKGNFNRSYENEAKFDKIILGGTFFKYCENDLVIKNKLENLVPYFNGRIFLENKEEIGKVDEILGPINDFFFSVKLKEGTQTLPLSRFLPQDNKAQNKTKKKKRSNRYKVKNNSNPNIKKSNNFSYGGHNRNDRGGRNDGSSKNMNNANFRNGKNNFKKRSNSGRKFSNQRGRF